MTYEEMIARYIARDAARAYIIGFAHHANLYAIRLTELPRECIKLNKSSSNAHGECMKTLRLKLNGAACEKLIAQGATLIGPAELVAKEPKMNSGEKFEKLVIEHLTGKAWVKDSTPYWVAGDMELDGVQVQIKFNNATLTTEKALG